MSDLKSRIKLYEHYRHAPEVHPELLNHMRDLLAIHLIKETFSEYIPIAETPLISSAQFISIMVHPEAPTTTVTENRERLFKMLLSAFLFEEKGGRHAANKQFGRETVKLIVEKYELEADWQKINRTLRKATNKLMPMLYAYQSYDRFEEYLALTNEERKKGIEYFLANTARAYTHIGFDAEDYQSLLDSEGISSSDQLSNDPLMDKPNIYRRISKPALHLLNGFYASHLCKYPVDQRHLRCALFDLEWVEPAIKLSHLSLARHLLEDDMVKLGASRIKKTQLKLDEIVFVDSKINPFFS